MHLKTIEEYKFLRAEMQAVKNCITTYTGYLLGGSGAAVLGLGTLYQFADGDSPLTKVLLAAGCLILSLFVPLVYLVLLYKFNSHNRFAGYCKVLSHERRLGGTDEHPDHVIAWEYSMAELRRSELNPQRWVQLWNEAVFEGRHSSIVTRIIKKYGQDEHGFLADQRPRLRSWRALWKCLVGNTRSYSWTFPAHITALFAWITLGFVGVGTLFTLSGLESASIVTPRLGMPQSRVDYVLTLWLMVLATQATVWYTFGLRMHALLYGSATVNAYAWRFLPIRVAFLKDMQLTPEYVGLTMVGGTAEETGGPEPRLEDDDESHGRSQAPPNRT